ncbi:MAG: amidohydrolase family protein [Candidatus Cloacimonetes bacterium]|nr:amidohydrolase family protein [Candidatus Cloacimonadota bacterium]
MDVLLKNGLFVYPEEGHFRISQGDMAIVEGIIQEKIPEDRPFIEINCEGKVVMPGLVNAHHHIYSTLSKGIPCETPFHNFLGNLENLWWRLDRSLTEEDMLLSTVLTMEECLKQGVTTVFDHHISVPFIENSLSKMAEVFEAYGVQGTLAFEISDRNGKDIFARSLAENLRFAAEERKVKGMLGMHASFTLSDESMGEIAAKSGNLPIHIHVGEDVYDGEKCRTDHSMSVLARLDKFGLLRKNSLLVHCSNLDAGELEILTGKPVFVAQAVDSNMNNGLNVADFHKLWEQGIACVVGTDGMHSSALKALKNSYLMLKYQNRNADIGFGEMGSMLWQGYKLKTDWGFDLGINAGEKADLAVFDYLPATPLNDETFLGHFIFGITEAKAQYVVKGGEVPLFDNELMVDPYYELKRKSLSISRALFKRFEETGRRTR